MNSIDKQIISYLDSKVRTKTNYLDFQDENMNYSTHKYHDYPATMIPKLPALFIDAVTSAKAVESLYDPFMGSGTTLVEGIRHNVNSAGVDLNPLAVLISQVKTNKVDSAKLKLEWNRLWENITTAQLAEKSGKLTISKPLFKNIDYWFKPDVIHDLQLIKMQILKIANKEMRNFFWVVFSKTVRYVSNTRNNEFKLYRLPAKQLATWQPDTIDKFKEYALNNIKANNSLTEYTAKAQAIFGNAQSLSKFSTNAFDLLITSPPYGDSQTTVAYGQFSRLSLQWLNLEEYPAKNIAKIDKLLLGGELSDKEIKRMPSKTLNEVIEKINSKDHKRALEVLQFYEDLFIVLKETIRVMKPNSYQFWVTANRTVKGITLPTNKIIAELYHSLGVKKVAEYTRNIVNKRVSGTMKQENIMLYKTTK